MNRTLNSRVGQKMIETGIQATGGIGRRISTIGNIVSNDVRFIAIIRPRGTPIYLRQQEAHGDATHTEHPAFPIEIAIRAIALMP